MIYDIKIWDRNLNDNIDRLMENPEGITKVIINGATELNYGLIGRTKSVIHEIIEHTRQHNIELHIITATHESAQLLPKADHLYIHFWPTFWLTMTFSRLSVNPSYERNKNILMDVRKMDVCKNTPILHPFISMNKAPKMHRAIMMDMLAKYDIVDKGVVIWREWCEAYQFKYWKQEIKLRDQREKFVYQEVLPVEYATSFSQLVPETDEIIFGMSEKASMPLFFNKPFLVAGCVNYHKIVQDMGFKLYDELFDYSFDTEPDIVKRYDMIAQNFINYTDKTNGELKAIYNSVFEKCQYNKRRAMQIATDSTLIPEIWHELAEHQAKNNKDDYPVPINKFIYDNEEQYRFPKV